MRIALCDDDSAFTGQTAELISGILEKHKFSFSLDTFSNGNSLIEAPAFDIVFLDVEMDGLSGLETAEKLRQREDSCEIVFLSSHEKYVFSAFDVQAAQYLTKPLSHQKLEEVLLRLAEKTKEKVRFITIKSGADSYRVPLFEIRCIEVLDRKIFIYTQNDTHAFYGKLSDLELSLPESFFRCHRSYIVNLAHVKKYSNTSVTLDSGKTALVARRKYPEFANTFMRYLKKNGGLV